MPRSTKNKVKVKNLYEMTLNPIKMEAALIEVRYVANGFCEGWTDLQKLQDIANICSKWDKTFLDCLHFQLMEKK